ncbi:MAG TPA: hypothetical protein VLT33_32035, partial [Labilithrix sp.]|nr:hypothetical protein [Labilithrix sp.]
MHDESRLVSLSDGETGVQLGVLQVARREAAAPGERARPLQLAFAMPARHLGTLERDASAAQRRLRRAATLLELRSDSRVEKRPRKRAQRGHQVPLRDGVTDA